MDLNVSLVILSIARVLTYEQIAKRCDTCKSSIAGWASGAHKPTTARLKLLVTLWEEFKICQSANVQSCPNKPM